MNYFARLCIIKEESLFDKFLSSVARVSLRKRKKKLKKKNCRMIQNLKRFLRKMLKGIVRSAFNDMLIFSTAVLAKSAKCSLHL